MSWPVLLRVARLRKDANTLAERLSRQRPRDGKRIGRAQLLDLLVSQLGAFLDGWQDLDRTYTPGERQLACRIDAHPVLG